MSKPPDELALLRSTPRIAATLPPELVITRKMESYQPRGRVWFPYTYLAYYVAVEEVLRLEPVSKYLLRRARAQALKLMGVTH